MTEAAFLGLQEKRPGTEMAREREGTIFLLFWVKDSHRRLVRMN